jgi:transcriptional regulator GlxA family with amidase domain
VLVLEPAAIADQLDDLDLAPRAIDIPQPIADADRFVALHRALEDRNSSRLAHETLLTEYMTQLLDPRSSAQSRTRALHDRGLLRACDLLIANPARNVSLDELARAAGIPRFRILRLFRAAFGAPPHRFQLAQRIRQARQLLERGVTPSAVAAATGFVDQAHMHRHFARTLGITPARYSRAFASARTYKTTARPSPTSEE